MRTNRWSGVVVGLLGLAVLGAGISPASADHFKPLSPNHTAYGVGQLNYAIVPHDSEFLIKLMNPVHVTQAAALIAYESPRSFEPGISEKYLTCHVRVLTPHGTNAILEEEYYPEGVQVASYAEVIWAPVTKVSPGQGNGQNRRIADGLGGNFNTARDLISSPRIAHPGLFSLPSNSVVAGQREAAIACVCAGLVSNTLPSDTFSEFGITCP